MQHRQRPHVGIAQRCFAGHEPQAKGFGAGNACDEGEPIGLQGVGEHLQGETAAVGHEKLASGHGPAVAVQDEERRDRAGF